MTSSKVSILGCGWVGKALKIELSANTYNVHCLTRDVKENVKKKLYTINHLVIAIPPRDNYLEVLRSTLTKVDVSTQVILLSSISFYQEKPSVIEAEALVQHLHKNTVILRLGGLMGYNRVAGKYTATKILTTDSKTNYIHRDDVVGIIRSVIKNNITNEIFDVVAPKQSSKKEIFTQNAKIFGFAKTTFLSTFEVTKVFSPNKIYEILDYTFRKKDVKEFWR